MTQDLWYKPKLIEVALPLEDISRAAAKEKTLRHGHPSTLHLWWSRKPLAAARAVLFAQLVDDPSAHPDQFPTEAEQEAERRRLHDIVSRLVAWENIHDERLLREAHEEILKSTNGNPPPILDPFAGGGSIPLEAQRLGLEAHASDLNPVAVLINKALIELPSKWSARNPIFPSAAEARLTWPGTTGFAEDIRRYGHWMREEAQKRIGHLYPKVTVSGIDAPVIAWIWARTVRCPSPACGGTMPLISKFWLAKKYNKERYITATPGDGRAIFEIAGPDGVPRGSTVKGRTGAVCLLCNAPATMNYIRDEAKAGRMGMQLMAIAAEGKRRRYYVAPSPEQEQAVNNIPRPSGVPEGELPGNARWFSPPLYGMASYGELFTNRQLTLLTTLSDLISEVHSQILADSKSEEYADAISTALALITSRLADRHSAMVPWDSSTKQEAPSHVFTRQAIGMNWEIAEANPFGNSTGNLADAIENAALVIQGLPASGTGGASQNDAAKMPINGELVSTDPPYYDNIGYANLSDFFYVWLRRSLRTIYPELLGTVLTPKADELVADPYYHETKANAERFFEEGFSSVFRHIRSGTPEGFPVTVFYAFKQSESDGAGGQKSTGWETLLESMIGAGWAVTATWPIRTELVNRAGAMGANSLAASIALACRPRPTNSGFTDRRGFIADLRDELPLALRRFEEAKVAPVDLRQAAIGPGMAVFSRYARVNEPDGSPMRVRAALSLINQVLDEKLSQLVGNVSADTRFCVEWFKQYEFGEGPFGTADTLARGVDTGVDGLVRAGVLRSVAGKVRLRSVQDIPDEYDPAIDERTSEWEICLHLAKQLNERGTDAAARLMAAARDVPGIDLDDVRELAYLLYSIAEKKNWAEVGLLFNNLGTSWTDLEDAARRMPSGGVADAQGQLALEFGSNDDGDE